MQWQVQCVFVCVCVYVCVLAPPWTSSESKQCSGMTAASGIVS